MILNDFMNINNIMYNLLIILHNFLYTVINLLCVLNNQYYKITTHDRTIINHT